MPPRRQSARTVTPSCRLRPDLASLAPRPGVSRLGVLPGTGDVVKMMDWIVDQVPAEGLDREMRSVAAAAGALPLAGGDGVEVGCDNLCSGGQLRGYHDGVLLAVPVRDRCGVLIPVRVQGPVLREHQGQPLLIKPQHIANMAAILQRRPPGR